jgi:hypothetical protein
MIEMRDYPKVKTGAVSSLTENETIVVLPEKGQVKVLNDVASQVWKMLDGSHSIQQIVKQISVDYEIAEESIQDDILEFVQVLLEREMITLSDRVSSDTVVNN